MTPSVFFSIDLSAEAWAAIGLTMLSALYLLCFLLPRLRRVSNTSAGQSEDLVEMNDDSFPPVSVIVYSQNDASGLKELIPEIFAQDYPAEIEVIVVNDEGSEATEDAVKELRLNYPDLYLTFSPSLSRNLSRRKLAITIGMKAAHHDAVVFTCGNCRLNSNLWLRAMARHFAMGKEVVLGYGVIVGKNGEDEDNGGCRRTFDKVFTSVRWISSALSGKPVMGMYFNLAYTRRLFFSHKGFSKSLSLFYGDDDIFINEIADADNCAVEISEEARVEFRDTMPAYIHKMESVRRAFTSRFIPRGGYRLFGSFSLATWIWLLSSAASCFLALPSLVGCIAVVVIAVGLWWPLMAAWRRGCGALGVRRLLFAVPFLSLWHPFYAAKFKLKALKKKNLNYTWGTLR